MRVARRYVIGGRVQGVGFRYFTKAAAVREGVAGWVRNLADGRVEVMLDGEQDAVDWVEARQSAAARPRHGSNRSRSRTTSRRPGRRGFSSGDDVEQLKARAPARAAPFPKPGILFYDITTLLKDAEGFRLAIGPARCRSRTEARAFPWSSVSKAVDSTPG